MTPEFIRWIQSWRSNIDLEGHEVKCHWETWEAALEEQFDYKLKCMELEHKLANLKFFGVYHYEAYVGSFHQGTFTSREKAEEWILTHSEIYGQPVGEYSIVDETINPTVGG